MSRTDKTAPWQVKAHYEPYYLIEQHNHEDGVCDLPDRPKVGEEISWRGHPHCYWDYSYEFLCSRWSRCGCSMCSPGPGWPEDYRNAKRQRREGRRLARDWWREDFG